MHTNIDQLFSHSARKNILDFFEKYHFMINYNPKGVIKLKLCWKCHQTNRTNIT